MIKFVKHYAYASEDGGVYLVGELYMGREFLRKVWCYTKTTDTIEKIKANLGAMANNILKDRERAFEINNKTDKVWRL